MTAEIRVLSEGYLSGDDDRVGSTVGFAREGGVLVVIDPGLVPGRDAILRPLAELELSPEQITDVVLSHHHPPQVRPSARAAAAMSSGVVPQQPPISDAPASFQARGRSGGRASCRGGSVHVLRIGSQNEPRFG